MSRTRPVRVAARRCIAIGEDRAEMRKRRGADTLQNLICL
jgi:hypothetical protein